MRAAEAKAIASEELYLRQIRLEAELGKNETTIEFVDKLKADACKTHLQILGYTCSKIKQHSNMFGDDFTMVVKW